MNWLIDAIGSVGAILFATACVPMAWKTWKLGRSIGTPATTVWTFVGATFSFGIYLGAKVGWTQVPTILIYVEFVCWSLALWYEYFPRPKLDFLGDTDYGAFGGDDQVKECIRADYHDGPCNGWPRITCPMVEEVRVHFHPVTSAEEIFKRSSD